MDERGGIVVSPTTEHVEPARGAHAQLPEDDPDERVPQTADAMERGRVEGRRNVRRVIRACGLVLVAAGVVLIAFWAYLLWGTGLTERAAQARLGSALHREFPSHPGRVSPAGGVRAGLQWPALADGAALARIDIPKIGLDQVVVEGTTTADLRMGPGHYAGTALPGEPGNVGIAGHRTTYGHPFYRLAELAPGDSIALAVPGFTWRYVVTGSAVVAPSDVAVIGPVGPGGWLTLTTCNPPYQATTRLIVRARLAGTADALSASTRPSPSGPAGGTGAGSRWALAGWAALVVATAACVASSRRWRLRPAPHRLVLGMLVLLAVAGLWELFGSVAALLPSGY